MGDTGLGPEALRLVGEWSRLDPTACDQKCPWPQRLPDLLTYLHSFPTLRVLRSFIVWGLRSRFWKLVTCRNLNKLVTIYHWFI